MHKVSNGTLDFDTISVVNLLNQYMCFINVTVLQTLYLIEKLQFLICLNHLLYNFKCYCITVIIFT